MESSTIELQLWIIIGLFCLVLVGQLFCAFYRRAKADDREDRFYEMWEKGELDDLIVESQATLQDRPSNKDALYFGSKALHARGQYQKAKEYIERLILIEPSLKDSLEETLLSIEGELAANKSPQPTGSAGG